MNRYLISVSSAIAMLGIVADSRSQDAQLTAIHGVPGLPAPVEVFANGGSLFSFDYGDQRGPLGLPAGGYAIDVQLNGVSILAANVTLSADTSYSAIAHLDPAGAPTISLFTNDRSNLALPQSRLVVRHTAEAPAVDVVLEQGGTEVARFGNLSNPNEVQADVAPGSYDASLFVAGTTTRAFGPASVALEDGYSYVVYAVGVVGAPSFRLLFERLDLAARVSVVHGIPGLPAPVDVFAGASQLFSFDFNEIRGPLVLNPGTYPLSVRLQGVTVLSANATVGAGDNVTVVAHLDTAGANTLSVFANDVSPVSSGARLTVRHTADAPAVDIGLDSRGNRIATIPNLMNGNGATAEVPSGLYSASIFAAGTSQVAFGPVSLKPATGIHYLVYAIGDLNAGSFTLLTQVIDLSGAVPGRLATQVGGQGCGPTIGASAPTFDYGVPFEVTVAGGMASGMAFINVGDSVSVAGGLRLPAALDLVGAPGCFLNTNFIATHPVMLDASGAGAAGFIVPAATFGSLPNFYFQFFTATTGNQLGFAASEYLEVAPN